MNPFLIELAKINFEMKEIEKNLAIFKTTKEKCQQSTSELSDRLYYDLNKIEESVVKFNLFNGENQKISDIMEASILERIGDTITMVISLKKQIIDGELFEWKRLQQQHKSGEDFNSRLFQIQAFFEVLAEIIWELKSYLNNLAKTTR